MKRICSYSALALLLLLLLIAIGLSGFFGRKKYVFNLPKETVLTEQIVLKYSKETLTLDGKHSPSMKPVQFWNDYPKGHQEFYFARNTIDSNNGYVLWKVDNNLRGRWDYTVTISRHENELICEIHRPK